MAQGLAEPFELVQVTGAGVEHHVGAARAGQPGQPEARFRFSWCRSSAIRYDPVLNETDTGPALGRPMPAGSWRSTAGQMPPDQAGKTNSKARDYDAALMPERLDRK